MCEFCQSLAAIYEQIPTSWNADVRNSGSIASVAKDLTGDDGAHVVFDAVAGPGFAKLAEATSIGGMLVLYGALNLEPTVVPPFQTFGRDLTIHDFAFPNVARNDQRLAAVRQFVNEGISNGSLVPAIARTSRSTRSSKLSSSSNLATTSEKLS